ncbi:MAG TPA: DUF1772 domain-containing protein [Euzebyales bacterium]
MTVGVLTLATVLAGLLAGNELSTLTVSHPALDRLPLPTQIAAERVLTRRLGRIMPFVMTTTIAVTVVAAVLLIGEPGFGAAVLAAVALIAMLATTLIGNVPRNRRTEQFPHDGTLEEWRAIRRPWHRLHTARVALDIFAFVALVLAVLVR